MKENKKKSVGFSVKSDNNSRSSGKKSTQKPAKGSALIIIFGSLGAILSTSSANVKNAVIRNTLLIITIILIVICLIIIYEQKKEK